MEYLSGRYRTVSPPVIPRADEDFGGEYTPAWHLDADGELWWRHRDYGRPLPVGVRVDARWKQSPKTS